MTDYKSAAEKGLRTNRDAIEASEGNDSDREYKTAAEMGHESSEVQAESAAREKDSSRDYETAEDRERARVNEKVEAMLRPAEWKEAQQRGQTATEYARAELGVSGAIEAAVQDEFGSIEFKANQIKASLPDGQYRRGNEAAEFALTHDEMQAAKRAGISAVDMVKRAYGIDATLHDQHSLQDAVSEVRSEEAQAEYDQKWGDDE